MFKGEISSGLDARYAWNSLALTFAPPEVLFLAIPQKKVPFHFRMEICNFDSTFGAKKRVGE
ncbi:hypothetical protein NC99_45840 [Sunxiuqinia dokdonensis]|uniref:Uncharacterized protein n=1 Tax=Sunxiuqinia dokdonensis TaxID=1409788 RepID=A0A0L8V2C6_9BACT|nr:hypothetical protein NC99_45840 [Sunxiuqinia dokdonensis]